MVVYEISYHKDAISDIKKLQSAKLDKKAKELIEIIKQNPFESYPPYEKLVGNLSGFYSRRINKQHRLIYMVNENLHQIKILRMWTHYE